MGRTENVELTTLCLIRRGGEILLQDRLKKDWPGLTLPGGHVEPGESIVDSVIREMKEETGLTIKNPRLKGLKQFPIDGGRYIVFLFEVTEFEGEIVSSEEGTVAWYRREEVAGLESVKDLEELLQVFEREDLTEFIYTREHNQWIMHLR